MRTARDYRLGILEFRELPEVDRLLRLALTAYEDRIDPSTGQDIALATNPLLADYWTTMHPVRDYAATALARAQEQVKDETHPHALRHVVGLREGWQDVLAAGREGATADHQGHAADQQ